MAVDGGMLERKRWWGLVREGSRQRRCQDGWIRRPLTLPRISPPLHADPSMGGVDLGTMAAEWRRGGGCGGGGRNGKHDGHGSTQLWPDPTSRFENFIFFDQNSLYKLNMHACLQAIALPHAKMQVVRPPTYENQF